MKEVSMDLVDAMERLIEAVARLEETVQASGSTQGSLAASAEAIAEKIVATVESQREAELERKLAEAEAKIAELMAGAAPQQTTRKTLPASTATMLTKQGVAVESMEAGALDGALASLSVEQRIAVKSELLRAGLLG
ncbi:MAG TPA: hypothetical protein VHY48_02055 [Acidobacteriaceae bacterium]|nr:hypothetical protein [Acidobacteriaceae bacterium]